MSSVPHIVPGSHGDPKAIEFLEKLAEKTRQKKVIWSEWEKGFLARLPDNILVAFHSSTQPPYTWTFLTVQAGNQTLFRVAKSLPDQLLEYALTTDPAQKYANDLYALITGMKGNPLDKALKSLENL